MTKKTMIGSNSCAPEELKKHCEKIEKLMEDKRAIAEEIREVYSLASATGFDKKTIREMIKLRAKSVEERQEEEHLRDLYMKALGIALEDL